MKIRQKEKWGWGLCGKWEISGKKERMLKVVGKGMSEVEAM